MSRGGPVHPEAGSRGGPRTSKKRFRKLKYPDAPPCINDQQQPTAPVQRPHGVCHSLEFEIEGPIFVGRVRREHKMLQVHLPRVIYHQVY